MRLPFLLKEFDAESERVTVDILAAVARFENAGTLSTSAVRSMLVNDALRERIAGTSSQDEHLRLVRETLVGICTQIESQKEGLEAELRAAKGTAAELTTSLSDAKEESASAKERGAFLETQLASLANEVEQLRQMTDSMRRRAALTGYVWKWVIAPLVGVFALSGGAAYVLLRFCQWPAYRGAGLALVPLCYAWLQLAETQARRAGVPLSRRVARLVQWARRALVGVIAALVLELLVRVFVAT